MLCERCLETVLGEVPRSEKHTKGNEGSGGRRNERKQRLGASGDNLVSCRPTLHTHTRENYVLEKAHTHIQRKNELADKKKKESQHGCSQQSCSLPSVRLSHS